MSANALLLTNLVSDVSFIFKFFPTEIATTGRANWRPQEVAHGVKPLLYENREPRRLEFPELWLDNSLTGESVAPEVEQLMGLLEESREGWPPPLAALWGDRQERVVLEEVKVTEVAPFKEDGVAVRAKVALTLVQVQDDGRPRGPVRENENSSFTF
jgi:hypothetical protein